MPDYFVALDTTLYTRFHRAMQAKGLVINSNLRYVDSHRSELKERYATFADYQQTFETPETMIDELVEEAEKQNIKPENKAELKKTLPYLKLQLKALIARDLWGMDEYFAIMNEQNPIVQEAVRLVEQE